MSGGDKALPSGQPEGSRAAGSKRTRECPICGRPAAQESYPFCSRRCADVDLNRWLSGAYAIPGADPAEPDAEDA